MRGTKRCGFCQPIVLDQYDVSALAGAHAPVAQQDRATDCYSVGQGFESPQVLGRARGAAFAPRARLLLSVGCTDAHRLLSQGSVARSRCMGRSGREDPNCNQALVQAPVSRNIGWKGGVSQGAAPVSLTQKAEPLRREAPTLPARFGVAQELCPSPSQAALAALARCAALPESSSSAARHA